MTKVFEDRHIRTIRTFYPNQFRAIDPPHSLTIDDDGFYRIYDDIEQNGDVTLLNGQPIFSSMGPSRRFSGVQIF